MQESKARATQREKATGDLSHMKQIKDMEGRVLLGEKINWATLESIF